MANHEDGLSTIGEIKAGAYIWFFGVLILSSAMVYNFARYDGRLWANKNKYIDGDVHRENRLSSTSLPHTSYDSRTDVEFSKAAERISQ